MKLSEYAKQNNVTWRTAYRWFQEGKIPGAEYTPGGSIIVKDVKDMDDTGINVIYARVSNSSRRKTDLEYQAQRLVDFTTANGWTVDKVVKEVGSGLNDNRKLLNGLFQSDEKIDRIIVEHKDRLTRFGYKYIEMLAEKQGTEIVVVNKSTEDKDDLVEDLVSIITSFCARIYGQRRSKRKTEEMTEILKGGDEYVSNREASDKKE